MKESYYAYSTVVREVEESAVSLGENSGDGKVERVG